MPVNLPADFPDIPFRGRARLIAAIDAAVSAGDHHVVVTQLRDTLCRLISDPDVELPASVHAPLQGHYARRELYRSPAHGYSVVAMTWAPGQGTPIHDHDGLWCVEGIWQGHLEITQYELLEADADRYRFRVVSGMQASAGSAGSLIPPHEHHAIRNPPDGGIAISLHVYQAPILRFGRFEPEDGEWHRRHENALTTDRID